MERDLPGQVSEAKKLSTKSSELILYTSNSDAPIADCQNEFNWASSEPAMLMKATIIGIKWAQEEAARTDKGLALGATCSPTLKKINELVF